MICWAQALASLHYHEGLRLTVLGHEFVICSHFILNVIREVDTANIMIQV
jgi:hypothetical protein